MAKEFLGFAAEVGVPELRFQRNLAWVSNWGQPVMRFVSVVAIDKQCRPTRGLFRQQMADTGVHMIDGQSLLWGTGQHGLVPLVQLSEVVIFRSDTDGLDERLAVTGTVRRNLSSIDCGPIDAVANHVANMISIRLGWIAVPPTMGQWLHVTLP